MINPQALTKMVINATHGNVEANATVALSVFKNDHMVCPQLSIKGRRSTSYYPYHPTEQSFF